MSSRLACAALALWASLASAAAAATCKSCEQEASQYLSVHTTNGLVTGHRADTSACVVEYLGIPFAKPPVGDLRFAAPQPLDSKKSYSADSFGFDCPLTASGPVDFPGFTPQAQQIINFFASAAGTPQSEDCLTLNIWSKATKSSAKADKPVWVFFYGGRFTIGNTDSPFYNGKYFADAEDIIVVTVNYRLNVFGFPGAPGQEQMNFGLRDQRAAVEWLRDNIANFGGNPDKITISGQSSGGVAVDYWTYAYRDDPIAHAIIAHSGNAFSFPVNEPGVNEANWNKVVAAVGCDTAKDVLACMREVDWQTLEAASATIPPASSTSVLRSVPAFYPQPDNEIVFPNYVNLTKAGDFVPIPILYGNNNNEAGYYEIPAFAKGVVPTPEQASDFILESFTCPVQTQVEGRREHGVPSWAYRYFGDWENTRLYPTSGAYHGVDLHMIFGASADVSGLPTTADQRKLTKLMQHAWYTFCDNPTSGLAKLGYPEYNSKTKSLIQLGLNNKPEAVLVKPSKYDSPCSTITLGALGTAAPTST